MLWIPSLPLHLDGTCGGALKLVPCQLIITSKISVGVWVASLTIAHLIGNGKEYSMSLRAICI